ncbi:MAG: ribosome hibernation-promoting factor, HPF/YfiA family [Paracoccaceae bacterium]
MRIQVTGKHINIGEALRSHVESEIQVAIGKYAERPVEAAVTFSRNGHAFVCDCSVHLSTGLTAQSHGSANEIYSSFDNAADRLEKQLRRYKRRLKDHHKNRPDPIEAIMANAYVLAGNSDEEAPEPESLQPVIVAETQTKVKSLSVGEAVMQMELAGAPLLVFRNDAHGGVNVVYRREDGNVGWIDPRNARQ